MGVIHLNKSGSYFGITTVIIILIIFTMVTFTKANEGLNDYEKQDLKNGTEQYLSKGAN